ncbi:MAG: 5-formyltetrahydrofolate cyclo-ligase [Myxococcota bacterium]
MTPADPETRTRIDLEKSRLRHELSARRRGVSASAAAEAARAASQRLLADARFRRARRVGLYAALPDELPVGPLFEALSASGAVRLLPRTASGQRLEFARVERWEDLRPGRYGVLEPPEGAPLVELEQDDAVVVPGVAFDPAGHRLGRGKGYYDRTFPPGGERTPLLFGFAYAFQLVGSVPCGDHDRRVDAIVTEDALQWVVS